MVKKPDTNKARLNRHKRVRGKVSGTALVLALMFSAPLTTSTLSLSTM